MTTREKTKKAAKKQRRAKPLRLRDGRRWFSKRIQASLAAALKADGRKVESHVLSALADAFYECTQPRAGPEFIRRAVDMMLEKPAYRGWTRDCARAILKCDLSFVEKPYVFRWFSQGEAPETFRALMLGAFRVMCAWIWARQLAEKDDPDPFRGDLEPDIP